MHQVENKTGIVFSVWINDKAAAENRACYSIHALKLGQLNAYSITSRDFASEFRRDFAALSAKWPNLSVDYGPANLMEGWIDVTTATAEARILSLLKRFSRTSPLIDRLLEGRRK